ncbi:MAG: translation initiation factor [Verrucomicrobiota bacterium]
MGKKKQKIDISQSSFGGSLNNAFDQLGSLDTSSLPEGTTDVPVKKLKEDKVSHAKKGRVVLRRETAHRGGKAVIIVSEFPGEIGDEEIESIARSLRKQCGTGGTVKNREIEIQGNQPAPIRSFLEKEGYRVVGVT